MYSGKGVYRVTEHRFGGIWTEVKLDAINEYSRFYTTALQKQNFELWYIDAFAGTGSRTATRSVGGILDGVPVENVDETLDGSVLRALNVQPPFTHLRLIEQRASHFQALLKLRNQFLERDIEVVQGNANDKLTKVFSAPLWTSRTDGWRQRALVFLDPYGINVRWETLRQLAATERADVWYLVNLKGVCQQLPRNHARLDVNKRRSMSEFFGGDDWEDEFYSFEQPQTDLLGLMNAPVGERAVERERVGQFYRDRLQKRLFRYVSPPLSLRVKSLDDYFQLYCMSNNPSENARALIDRGARAVIKKHSGAFRRMSGL